MEAEEVEIYLCPNCNLEIAATSRFCRHCGQAHQVEDSTYVSNKLRYLRQVAVFFAVELTLCLSGLLFDHDSIALDFYYQAIGAISAIIFFSLNWQENKSLLKWPKFSVKYLAALIFATFIGSSLVQFLVGHLNNYLFKEDQTSYFIYSFQPYGLYLMVISIAVFPALFEELAYRGFLMQKLLKIVDRKEAIYITSILFFLIHFSLISIFWLLPFAILLGYIRMKTNTLWYGVAIHFIFNFTSCLWEIYTYGSLF